jgi:N-acetylglutamate synthase-like GNAT family acetyltransferase
MSESIFEVYTDKYKEKVIELILHIQNDEFGIPITIDQQPDLKSIPRFYQTGKGNFWIGRSGDDVIGTVGLLDIGNNQAALRKMFVAESYRGREFQVAKKLLSRLFDWTVQMTIKEIFLGTTERFLRAQQFYEKNGFIEMKKEDLPLTFPVMDVDSKFYRSLPGF